MKKEMLINVSQSEECRIALLEDGVLEELGAIGAAARGGSGSRRVRGGRARFRGEPGPGGGAEDRFDRRPRRAVLAPRRPPAVEQGAPGDGAVRAHPVGGLAPVCSTSDGQSKASKQKEYLEREASDRVEESRQSTRPSPLRQ